MASRSNPFGFLARYWFPVGLVMLLVLAIPGFVLFALNLIGWQADVNRWLQRNLNLTYSLPIPWWGGLILLLLPIAILILYFLKLKRKPLSVPSTFLWKKSIEDLHVNSLLQWLRHNVLLLLQILAVLFMIYAVMGFRFHGRTGESRYYILMIDNSASMNAADVAPSRLEWAKLEALKEIDAASDSDFGMVIEFNSSAEIKQSYTNNRGVLRQAVRDIKPSQRLTRIEEALSLADSLANPTRSTENEAARPVDAEPGKERTYVAAEGIPTELHIFSDGRFPDPTSFALGNLNPHFHLAGQSAVDSSDNVALVTLNALRDESDASKVQIFARASNFRDREVKSQVQLEVIVDGRLKDVFEKEIKIAARKKIEEPREPGKEEILVRDTPGEGTVTFDLRDLDDRSNVVVHARLVNVRDKLPLDDEAWLVVGVVRKARVLIVTRGNDALQAFFEDEAALEVARIERLAPADLTTDKYLRPARDGLYDLVIFDRCGPDKEENMPLANTFFIGYPPPPWKQASEEKKEKPDPFTVTRIESPHIKGWMNKHAILRYLVALHEIGISEAFRISKDELPPRTPRLMESDQDVALMLVLSRQSYADLVMTFPIFTEKGEWNTNWPLKPSFPLFLRNVLYTLGNVSDAASEETVKPGQPKTIRPDAEMNQAVNQIKVFDPENQATTLNRGTRPDFTFGETDHVGVYQVWWNSAWQRSFAVNLLDSDESHIEPRANIQIGEERVAAGQERGQPREMWKWVVLAALFVLLAEWYIYNRRVYI